MALLLGRPHGVEWRSSQIEPVADEKLPVAFDSTETASYRVVLLSVSHTEVMGSGCGSVS